MYSFSLRWRPGSLIVWVVPSEDWSVADPVRTPVTVPKLNPRSWGVRFSRLPNSLYCGVGLVARNRTWTFSFRRKREGGQEAQRPVLWYWRPMVWHASMTVSCIGLRVPESMASAKASFVDAGQSPLRYLTAVFTRAMQREKVNWRSPKPAWWRGV